MIGTFLWHRAEIANIPGFTFLCIIVGAFLLSFPSYAYWIIRSVSKLEGEVKELADGLAVPQEIFYEFHGVRVAIAIGSIPFLLVLCFWPFACLIIGNKL
jgi:hypothetical protein